MKYFWLTLKHKWFVLLAGLKVGGIPFWRLLLHDLSKLTPMELPHYQRQFFGKADDPLGFIRCWVRHQNHNPHHWEYWIPRTGHNRCTPPYPDGEPVPMPEWAVREMVADWMGAGRAYTGKWDNLHDWTWLRKNLPEITPHLHRETRDTLCRVLGGIGAWPRPCPYYDADRCKFPGKLGGETCNTDGCVFEVWGSIDAARGPLSLEKEHV